MFDTDLRNCEILSGETNDSPRIQRAIDATPNGVLYIPKGDYFIEEPLFIRNRCSLLMHPAARLIAKKEMDYVVTYDSVGNFLALTVFNDDGSVYDNLGIFIKGGDIDGNGLASCLRITNAHHFTLRDTALHNGKKYGLCVGNDDGHIYELICENVYCKCNMVGLSQNIGIYSDRCDCHFIDCIIVDYNIGMKMTGSSNRLTRCHVWAGTVGPENKTMKEWSEDYGRRKRILYNTYIDTDYSALGDDVTKDVPMMLPGSISFDIGGQYNYLDGCCADTAEIGWKISGDTILIGCEFFNNGLMGLKKSTAIYHEAGKLKVMASAFRGPVGTEILYEGIGKDVEWIANMVEGGEGMKVPNFT